jgi:guanine nucleotide-binding protein subunit alpha
MRNILDAMTQAEKQDYLTHPSLQSPRQGSSHLTPELLDIKARLMPLFGVEKTLIRRLTTAGSGEAESAHGQVAPNHVVCPKHAVKKVAINSAIP